MKAMLAFTRHILAMPVRWQIWIAMLFLANMAAVAFLPRAEAVAVLVAVMVVCGISLVIDIVDVARYARGERKATIVV